jgi:hypothetical protein
VLTFWPYVWQLDPGHTYDEHLVLALKTGCDTVPTPDRLCAVSPCATVCITGLIADGGNQSKEGNDWNWFWFENFRTEHAIKDQKLKALMAHLIGSRSTSSPVWNPYKMASDNPGHHFPRPLNTTAIAPFHCAPTPFDWLLRKRRHRHRRQERNWSRRCTTQSPWPCWLSLCSLPYC